MRESLHPNRKKKLTSYLFTSKAVNSVLKMTDLFPYWQFVAKYLNDRCTFSKKNKLITAIQSGFRPVDSCVIQLLVINQGIHQSFPAGIYQAKLAIETLEQGVKYVQS